MIDNKLAKKLDTFLKKAEFDDTESLEYARVKSIMFLTIKFIEENYDIVNKELIEESK